MNKTYISYVIQSPIDHKHDSSVIAFAKDPFAIYTDNSSAEVMKWAEKKQSELNPDEKIIILSFFNLSNN
jgi:hypothetical protein